MNALFSFAAIFDIRSTLKAFVGVSKYDLYILVKIYQLNCPCSYDYIYSKTQGLSFHTFHCSIKGLVELGYLSRNTLHGRISYNLTIDGIKLLHSVNFELEQMLKEQLLKQLP